MCLHTYQNVEHIPSDHQITAMLSYKVNAQDSRDHSKYGARHFNEPFHCYLNASKINNHPLPFKRYLPVNIIASAQICKGQESQTTQI